jgi:hypothetical protein
MNFLIYLLHLLGSIVKPIDNPDTPFIHLRKYDVKYQSNKP